MASEIEQDRYVWIKSSGSRWMTEEERELIQKATERYCEDCIGITRVEDKENLEFFWKMRSGSSSLRVCRRCYSVYRGDRGDCKCGLTEEVGNLYSVRVTWKTLRQILTENGYLQSKDVDGVKYITEASTE